MPHEQLVQEKLTAQEREEYVDEEVGAAARYEKDTEGWDCGWVSLDLLGREKKEKSLLKTVMRIKSSVLIMFATGFCFAL